MLGGQDPHFCHWISSGNVYKSISTVPTWSNISQSSSLPTSFWLGGTLWSLGVGTSGLLSNVDCNRWSTMSKVLSSYNWATSDVLMGEANIFRSSVRVVRYTLVSVVLNFSSSGISLEWPLRISCFYPWVCVLNGVNGWYIYCLKYTVLRGLVPRYSLLVCMTVCHSRFSKVSAPRDSASFMVDCRLEILEKYVWYQIPGSSDVWSWCVSRCCLVYWMFYYNIYAPNHIDPYVEIPVQNSVKCSNWKSVNSKVVNHQACQPGWSSSPGWGHQGSDCGSPTYTERGSSTGERLHNQSCSSRNGVLSWYGGGKPTELWSPHSASHLCLSVRENQQHLDSWIFSQTQSWGKQKMLSWMVYKS